MKTSLSLVDLAKELERQRDTKVDYLVPPDRIQFVTPSESSSEIDLLGDVGSRHTAPVAMGLSLNENAHRQFATKLNIPWRFYEKLRSEIPTLLDENVNRLLRHNPKGTPSRWMVRTLDGVARAALSDQYRRIDNHEIAEEILPILQRIPDIRVRSAHISEDFMYIKATTPRVAGRVKVGQDVCAGVMIRNSEVGAGKFVVSPFVETLQCENGMVVMRKGDGMMEQIHLGRRVEADALGHIVSTETRLAQDRAFMMTVRDIVRAAVDEARFSDLVAEMSRASEDDPIEDVKAAVETLAKRESLTENEGRGVLTYLAAGGDLSRWGVISAVTRTAEDSESYDRATQIETLGGKILGYSRREWRELAVAS